MSTREHDDDGSLLIDVLIGMAIVALVALIAVSSVGSYREKARVTAMISDVANLGKAIEAAGADGTYPSSVTIASGTSRTATIVDDSGTMTMELSSGTTRIGWSHGGSAYERAADGNSFKFMLVDSAISSSAGFYYDSANGGMSNIPNIG